MSTLFSDRLIGALDDALRTLAATPHASRPMPHAAEAALTDSEKVEAARLMRVNHTGEVCAQALYAGQALFSRDPRTQTALKVAASEETDHLAWCEARISALGGRTSALNPLWFAGSFAMGTIAGALGDRVSLGFLAETERQVERHLDGHLDRLPAGDHESRAVLAQMREDEARHGATGKAMGGMDLPLPVQRAMAAFGTVMTRTAYWV